MRDLLLLGLLIASVIQTLRSPVFGVLSYTAISLVYPQSFAWGIARSIPIAQIQAIVTMASCAIHPSALRWKLPREMVLLLMFWGWTGITTLFALFPDRAPEKLGYVSKVMLMIVVTVLVLHTREHLIWLVRVVSMSLGLHGLQSGIITIGNGAKYMVWGPERSFLEANNAIGLALAMNIPLLFFQARHESSRWLKYSMWAMAALSYPAVIATYSRGAWLGLAASTAMIVLVLPFHWKVAAVVAGVLIALIVTPMMPDRVADRYEDLENYDTESSAQSRFWNWQTAWNVAVARPIFGAGFDYYSFKIYAMYFPEFLVRWPGKVWACHSAWFTVLSEHGFPGFTFWMGMVVATFLSFRRLVLGARSRPGQEWITNTGRGALAAMASFGVSATFLDAAYFDMVYNVISIAVVLKSAVALEVAKSMAANGVASVAPPSTFSPASVPS